MAIRPRMRRELGFVYRYHRGLVPNRKLDQMWAVLQSQVIDLHYEEQVHLDFYSAPAQTWFQLKYLNLDNT